MLKKLALLALALSCLTCATRQPGDPLTPGYNVFSKQQDVELGRQVKVAGHDGLIVGLTGRSPYGGAERNLLLTVVRPQGIFYLVFVAPESQNDRLQPTFEQMARSIRFR